MAMKYVALGVAAISAIAVIGAAQGSLRAISQSVLLQEALQSATEFVSLIKDVETSARGFVITGDESFLQPWNEANREFAEAQQRLQNASLALENDRENPQSLVTLAQTRIALSRTIIEARKRSVDEAVSLTARGEGKNVMDELRIVAAQFTGNLQTKTDAQWRLISKSYIPLGIIGLAGLIVSIAGLIFLVSREARATTAARNLMNAVMAGAPVGLALTDDGKRINSANRAFLELFASQKEKRLRDIPPHIQSALAAQRSDQPLNESTTHELTVEHDDEKRFIRLTTFPVQISGENGRVRDGTGIAAVDLTEERMLELHLAAARDDAEAANHAKSTFLANMSHELRTPLTAIIGYCELLQEETAEEGNSAVQADLDKINSNARHLLALINDVLDLSKIEAQKMDVHAVPFTLAAFLQDIESAVATLVAKNQNMFTITNTASDHPLHTDDLKLKQVLLNLVGNAAKFTHDGNITLTVADDADAASGNLVFTISDTGIGMSPEQMKNLFTRFNQADATTTRKYGGSGLGLALTKALVTMLGGTITMVSTEGEGSSFTVTVPREHLPSEPVAGEAGGGAAGIAAGQLVLIADDQRASREILERHLVRAGFRTLSVSTGTEALNAINEEHPVAVLLDVMMPGLDGWHVLRTLRNNPATRHIPVIMQTVLDERHFAFTLGADGYLKKPVRREDLLAAIADTIGDEQPQVLVVESDPDEAGVIEQQFEGTPWQVRRAETAQAAHDEIERNTVMPSLILVSANLPDEPGFQLVKRLRQRPALQNTLIYLLTNDRKTADRISIEPHGSTVVPKTEKAIRELVEDLRHLTHAPQKGTAHGTHSVG